MAAVQYVTLESRHVVAVSASAEQLRLSTDLLKSYAATPPLQ